MGVGGGGLVNSFGGDSGGLVIGFSSVDSLVNSFGGGSGSYWFGYWFGGESGGLVVGFGGGSGGLVIFLLRGFTLGPGHLNLIWSTTEKKEGFACSLTATEDQN